MTSYSFHPHPFTTAAANHLHSLSMFPRPAPFSPESSSLSSLFSNLTTQEEQESKIGAKLASYQPTGNTDPTITILKAFVSHLPRDGAHNVAQDILDCESNELRTLANHLLTAVLVPMKAHDKTPIATPSPRFGADDSVEEIVSNLINPSTHNDQAWLKAACLSRDNNRCIIIGFYDVKEASKHLSASELQRTMTVTTQVAHIIPFSLGSFAETELRNVATIWDAMYRYFPSIRSRANFSADAINDTCNAMTMDMSLHNEFENFRLALKPTSTLNVYRIKTYPLFPTSRNMFLPPSGLVTLTAHSPHHRLPSVSLLEAHAAITHILHMTGMGSYVENVLEERQRIRCLAADGGTDVATLFMVF